MNSNSETSNHTLSKYRQAYRFAWSRPKARRYMRGVGFKPPGSYDPNNQHGGAMFALPRDLRLTDLQAGIIMRHCWKDGGTLSQLENVRKMMSYTYQLVKGKPKGNWDEVKRQWGCQNPSKYRAPTQQIQAKVSVEVDGLSTAMTKEWSPECGMPYPEWCVAQLLVHDSHFCGARSVTDLERIKKSKTHVFAPGQGWMSTVFVGGRAKLERKKGIRKWKLYRVCLCPGGNHQPPPADWHQHLNHLGNPKGEVNWCTSCPLNSFQVVRDLLPDNDKRSYPGWLPAQLRYSKDNVGEDRIMPLIQRWLNIQGANPDNLAFDSNGGRKVLGKLCSRFGIPYHESIELHGDLWPTWKRHYQHDLQRDPLFKRRTQSRDVDECCAALWRIARGIGRGRTERDDPKDLSRLEALLALDCRARGMHAEVNRCLQRPAHELSIT